MALTKERMRKTRFLSTALYTLTNALTAYKGGLACGNTANGQVRPGGAATTLVPIGSFGETLTGDGTKKVRVDFNNPIFIEYFKSGTAGDAITAANMFAIVFIIDDETVGLTNGSSTRSAAGRVLDIDADGLIGVQVFPAP
jgi:hypothetical protein